MYFAVWKFWFTEYNFRLADPEFELVAIHIGTVFDGPVDLKGYTFITNDIVEYLCRRSRAVVSCNRC